jgi:hypothetical protein
MIKRIIDRLIERALARGPDFVIGAADNPYLRRWFLIPRNRFFNIYLHQFLRDDDDRALHDHPWPWLSAILRGAYFEITSPKWTFIDPRFGTIEILGRQPKHAKIWTRYTIGDPDSLEVQQRTRYAAGSIRCHRATFAHRLKVDHDAGPCWTLFVTGPRIRQWGFHCPKGWVHWEKFTAPGDSSLIGKGCDQ